MKIKFLLAVCMVCTQIILAQQSNTDIQAEAIEGVWEVQGNQMGEGESAWVMPHKHTAPDCGKDHTLFSADNTGSEVRFSADCTTIERNFNWTLDGDVLMLTSGDKSIEWHIRELSESKMTVGVAVRPGAENKMYVVYKKQTR